MALPYSHAILMSIGFFLFVCGVLVALAARGKRWRIKAHRAAGTAGAVLILSGVSVAAFMIETTSGPHLAMPHAWVGAAATFAALLTPVLGYALIKTRRNRETIGKGHRWSGRLTLLLLLAAILSGARLIGIL